MSNCLSSLELKELGNSMISDSSLRIASIPDDLCAPFHTEARELESNLLTIYRLCAMIARKEQDLKEIAKIWGGMIELCDTFGAVLNNLAKKHPQCGADSFYDRVLDLRNKCNRLKTLHE
jgi:hypothetical protein